jgi:hypothetical protein
MSTPSKIAALETALAALEGSAPVLTQAQRLRKLATVQRRQGMASIQALAQTRRWVAKAESYNPGVGQFYGVPTNGDVRARTLAFALDCRARANKAAAKAREIEASAQGMKWAAE